jgi:hypothetical protein
VRLVGRLGLVFVAVLSSRGAAAQDPRFERLPPESRAPVAQLVDSARAAGISVEPLIQRALEGATKHAAGELIVAAVRHLAVDLGRARDALGGRASPAELGAGATALRAGASPETLTELRRKDPHPLTVPLAVLTDLIASGVPVDSAAAAVLTLAAQTRDADLVEFRRAVERDIALGAAPGAAASAAAADMLSPGPQSTSAGRGQQGHPTKP